MNKVQDISAPFSPFVGKDLLNGNKKQTENGDSRRKKQVSAPGITWQFEKFN